MNKLEDKFITQLGDDNNNKSLSTETKVQLLNSEGKPKKYALGLLDTGATSMYIKEEVLKNIPHTLEP